MPFGTACGEWPQISFEWKVPDDPKSLGCPLYRSDRIFNLKKCSKYLSKGLVKIHGGMLPLIQVPGEAIFFTYLGFVDRAERGENEREH